MENFYIIITHFFGQFNSPLFILNFLLLLTVKVQYYDFIVTFVFLLFFV